MRHHNLWKKTAPVAALALASILALGAPFAAFADDDDDDTPLTLIDGYIDRQKKSLNLPSHTVLSGSAAENKKNTSISHESQ